jgi:hypothetical protein
MTINSYSPCDKTEKKPVFDWINKYKAPFLISIGIVARVIMLFYYYYTHMIDPYRSWGDVGINFARPIYYPPLTTALLNFFRYLSFGIIEVFAFYAFLWDLITSLMFYYVLKSFDIKNRNYIFGLFLVNPFWFLSNSFSLTNCGYHITDAFFFFFFFMALIYYPKDTLHAKYLFYIFLGLSMCIKYYTMPAFVLIFLKYLHERNWKEMKLLMICIAPLLIMFIIIPFLFLDWYSSESYDYLQRGFDGPIYVRFIPIFLIIILFALLRLKESDPFEISILSIIAVGTLIFFSFHYLRWFQIIIIYGILKERDFFSFNLNLVFIRREIKVDNNVLTFWLSVVGVIFSYIYLITFLRAPPFI